MVVDLSRASRDSQRNLGSSPGQEGTGAGQRHHRLFSASLFGLLADRIGRKRIIVASTAVFGLGTLATLLAPDAIGLLVIRFLTGLVGRCRMRWR